TASISALSTPSVFPMPAGTPITWTATATGSPGPLEYLFWRMDAGVWNIVQGYSTNNTFTWVPTTAGLYDLGVWGRHVGSLAPYEAFKTIPSFTVQAPLPLSVSALVAAPPVPKPQGSIIIWTPQTTGGIAPLSYKFWRYNVATKVWSIVQPWSTNNTFT